MTKNTNYKKDFWMYLENCLTAVLHGIFGMISYPWDVSPCQTV